VGTLTPNKTLQQTAATVIDLPGHDVAAVAAAAELWRSAGKMGITVYKSLEYYRCLDLDKAATLLAEPGTDRLRSEVFHDLLKAIIFRHKQESISRSRLLSLLGQPDRTFLRSNQVLLEYDWVGEHCNCEYRGSDRFLFAGDLLVAINNDSAS
jgi:hypothetical protein